MADRFETGQIEQTQASLEAVELLNRAGFCVEDFEINTSPEDVRFNLGVSLSISENERPLEALK